jgi:hypothetical protein
LVKFQPSWHDEHWALVLKSAKPRLAFLGDGLLVSVDPVIEESSKGARCEMTSPLGVHGSEQLADDLMGVASLALS